MNNKLLALAVLCFSYVYAISQSNVFIGERIDIREPNLNQSFKDYSIYKLNPLEISNYLERSPSSGIKLVLGSEYDWDLDLVYHDIRGKNFREVAITEQGNVVQTARRGITYRGTLNQRGGGEVRMSISESFFMGMITIKDEHVYIESLGKMMNDAPSDHFIVYKASDFILDGPVDCGSNKVRQNAPSEETISEVAGPTRDHECLEVEFALAADQGMWNRYGSITTISDQLVAVTNVCEALYGVFDLQYIVVDLFVAIADSVWTNSLEAFDILDDFRVWAPANFNQHDIGQIWVTRNIQGCGGSGPSLIGCADIIGGVCGDMRYNVDEDFSNSIAFLGLLSAHENGHLWDGVHSQADSISPSVKTIMWPSLSSGNTGWSSGGINPADNNTQRINDHIHSRQCLSDCGTLCGLEITTITPSAEGCPGASDGMVTVVASSVPAETITYILTGPSPSTAEISNTTGLFTGLADGMYTVDISTFFGSCTDAGVVSVDAGVDAELPVITNCPMDIVQDSDIDVCGSVVNFADVMATDNCDNNPVVEYMLTGEVVAGWTTGQASGIFYPVGLTTVAYRSTDINGNTSLICTFTITIEDNTPPVIDCPLTIIIDLGPGECRANADWIVSAIDNCDVILEVVLVQTEGPPSGSTFEGGTTTEIEYKATDFNGNTAICQFQVIINDFEDYTDILACNDNLNISVNQYCEAFVGPDMILEGGPYKCYDDYFVEIEGVGSGLGGVFIGSEQVGEWLTVTITDPETGNSCWGTIHVEDKFAPMLTCISVELPCSADTGPVYEDPIIGTASLTENPGSPIGPDGGTATTQEFVVVVPANAQVTDVDVRIDLTHSWSSDLDVVLIAPDGSEVILAQDVCGTANDWENVVFDDDAATPVGSACTGGSPALVGPVQPEEPLAALNGIAASGTWTLQITDDSGGDGGALNTAGIDVGYFVALPYAPIAHEACGEVDMEYSDEISGDQCSNVIIERTWTVTDVSGNSSTCVQTLTIIPLDLDDLVMPQAYVGECGGSIDPSVTGWPTIGGISISNGNVCNVFATWEDKPLPDCGGGIKIVRNWLVLDWCNQEVVKSAQVVKLTDNEGPVLSCPEDVTASTDTWNCSADVNLTAPTGVDACGTPFTLTPSASQGTLIDFGGYYRVDDLPLGATVIIWTAEDACGNTSTCSYIITVVDDIPPVPLCDEHTIVSLTNDNIDHGLTKVAAEVFDDGSYDNCGPITFEVRRMSSCIDFDWTTNGAGIDETPNGIVNAADKGTSFKPMVPFSCCDVAQGPIMVQLRVIDAYGNSNSCMVEIEVQDKLSPLITAPPTVEVSCEFWFVAEETNGFVPMDQDVLTPAFGRVLDAFDYDQSDRESIIIDDPGNDELPQPYNWGLEGWADDNCDVDITVRVRIWDDCSGDNLPSGAPSPYTVRLVERTFLAKDAEGNSQTAVQRIWVVDFEPFYISDETCVNSDPSDGVIWPCDEFYDNCPDGGVPVNYPTIFDDNCSLIGVTFEDSRFDFVEGACYKILREWTVIDWCQYEPHPEEEGIWRYTQVIKVIDSDGPEVSYPSTGGPYGPITLCVLDSNVSLLANNQIFLGENNPLASSCSVHIILEHDVVEMCSEIIKYDLKLYPNNGSEYMQVLNPVEAAIDSNGNGKLFFDSRASSLLGVRLNGLPYNSAYCSNWPLAGGEKDYHRVLWSMEDGCGNKTTFEYLLRLEDCKAPSPVCLGLSSVLMPSSGEVTIWAADFNASSFDDCTASADLLYSFSGTDYEPSRTFDCQALADNGSPSFLVEIYAVDEGSDQNCDGSITYDERNKDFCTTFIVIDDHDGVCGGGGTTGGLIETEELESVENVSVTLMDELGLMTQTIITDGSGTYVFVNPLLSYTIEPERDDNHANGVSTLDLVRIQKHLLGLEPFVSPYKLIAADANNSESVTALDLVEIRKLILGLNLEFPNNKSWRFVDAEFAFADENHPWPFDEIIDLEGGFNMEEDFMAMKIGDVNGTVTANATQIEVRVSRDILTLHALDRAVSVGEEVTVEVTAQEFASIFGYQFTLRTEGLKLISVDAGAVDMDEANVGIHKYHMTVSWHRAEAVDAQDGDVLFALRFVSTMDSQLSEMMSIGSEITEAEAYREIGADTEIMDIDLAFGDFPIVPPGVDFTLYQNEPNPFNDLTRIGFTLPEAMEAKLTVFDMTGRIIKIVEGEYNVGYNEIELLQQDLGTSGVLYYRLDAGDLSTTGNANFSASKKLIIIE